MTYKLIEDCAGTKRVLGLGLTLKEAYNLLQKCLIEDKDELKASYEDLEYAVDQNFGIACLYRFWGFYKIEAEDLENF